jgi:DNA-binding CsgD family transcriptional regulator/catechol 2,3-dioxygenase-like lactoylglutathione lyase family enzyme
MARNRGRPPHDDVLTPAEWRTVDAVRHGLTNREIANRRGISLDGVKYHVANALAKLALENRVALRRWRGAPGTNASGRKESDMNDRSEVVGLGQVARSVKDIGQTEAWYRDVLGLTHLFTFGKMAFFDCGGTRLMLAEAEDSQPAESILYFRVPEIEAAYGRLLESGAESLSAPHMIHRHDDGTEEWMAFFKDLEGRPIGIMASRNSADA